MNTPRPTNPADWWLCTRDDLHPPHTFVPEIRWWDGTEVWCSGLDRGDREYDNTLQTDFAHMEPGTGGDLPHETNSHNAY